MSLRKRRGAVAPELDVLIVGCGPAGLSAAYQLARKGHAVTIFDERAELGGMMRYGIPGFRTPRAVLDRLNSEISKITSRADVRKAWNEQGAEPLTMNVGEFEKYLYADIAKWAKVVKASGARADQ